MFNLGMHKRRSSNANNNGGNSPASAPAPASGAGATSVMGSSADAILVFQTDIFEHGRRLALTAGDPRGDETKLSAAEDHAEAMAREKGAEVFDSASSRHDQIREEEWARAKEELPEARERVKAPQEEVRKRRDALAELGELLARPMVPWLMFAFGSFLIALTVAPTLHDFFFLDAGDARQGWFFSVVAGTMAGLLIAWSLVGTFTSGTGFHWMGLVAGLLFGVALLLIRFTGARTTVSLMMAIGLAILEIAVVLLLDWIGRGLRRKQAEWEQANKAYSTRLAYLRASEAELACRQGEVTKLEKVITDFREHVFQREHQAKQVESLVRGARQAVRDGYHAGLAELEGRYRGKVS
ncbi:MAG: hypothetical protein WC683_14870 [bacterium]